MACRCRRMELGAGDIKRAGEAAIHLLNRASIFTSDCVLFTAANGCEAVPMCQSASNVLNWIQCSSDECGIEVVLPHSPSC